MSVVPKTRGTGSPMWPRGVSRSPTVHDRSAGAARLAGAPPAADSDGRRDVYNSPRAGRSQAQVEGERSPDPLRVVLCGSFRREPASLAATFQTLQQWFEVLSPLSVAFVNPGEEFVRLEHEVGVDASVVEQQHLDAITEADFVWLHAPDGYLGASAMFELGHAKALGVPVFSDTAPAEDTYRPWVHVVPDPTEVHLSQSIKEPGNGVRGLQRYYERTCDRRGWGNESANEVLLLMTEELGELARAVRKSLGLSRDQEWSGENVGEELADMQLYLVHLANGLGIDLADAVTEKEGVNEARVAARSTVA